MCLLIFDRTDSKNLFYGTILYFSISAGILITALASTPVSIRLFNVLVFFEIRICKILHEEKNDGNTNYDSAGTADKILNREW